MKIMKARQLLGKIIQPHGDLLNNRPVIKYQFGDEMVMLSGVFTYEDVEAVLAYMRSTMHLTPHERDKAQLNHIMHALADGHVKQWRKEVE